MDVVDAVGKGGEEGDVINALVAKVAGVVVEAEGAAAVEGGNGGGGAGDVKRDLGGMGFEGEGDAAVPLKGKPDPSLHVIAHVFKVTQDPFVGKMGIFRIHQGTLTRDSQLYIGDGRTIQSSPSEKNRIKKKERINLVSISVFTFYFFCLFGQFGDFVASRPASIKKLIILSFERNLYFLCSVFCLVFF